MISGTWDYLLRMLPGALLAALAYVCLLPVRKRKLERAGLLSPFQREFILFVFFLFCGGMALITLTPRWFHWLNLLTGGQIETYFQIGSVNLMPFRTFASDPWSLLILLGNVIMFIPIGFFAALLWRNTSWKRLLTIGLLTTLSIELVQLLIGRTFDIDDLLLNTLGVLLGGLLCRLLRRAAPAITNAFQVQII